MCVHHKNLISLQSKAEKPATAHSLKGLDQLLLDGEHAFKKRKTFFKYATLGMKQ